MSIQRLPNLWQIKVEYQSLLSKLYNHETGEVDMEVDAQLNQLTDNAESKCIAIAQWIKNLELERNQIEYMKKEILKREEAYEKEISKRFDYLKSNMEGCGISEIKSPYFTLRIKSNPYSTDVTDESQIPERFMRTKEIVKTERKPDRVAIKEEVLKTGVQIPGAYVGKKTKLEILIDKI
jgi:hypothetical protein